VNLDKRIALTLAVVTLLALTAAGASAAPLTRATFTLPAQAYWNDTLLQPGEYTLSITNNVSGVPLIRLQGEGINATFVAPAGPEEFSGNSRLKADDLDGTYVIRELDAGPLGKAFRFAVSKTVGSRALRGQTQPVTVPVSAASGF
jgi:hypothetical protein